MVVHWEQPGLQAKSETDGHGDTCGPIIIHDYMALKDPANWPLTNARLDTLRQDLINLGLMDVGPEAGMTISQIAAAFEHYGVKPVKVVTYNSALPFDQFHTDLISSLTNHQMVCYETTYALKLPNNQAGVDYHFVLLGGIDSLLGYWMANGDAYYALGNPGYVAPYWVGVQPIQASVPCGYIVLPTLDPVVQQEPQVITVEKDSSGNVVGAHDQNGNHIGAGFALAAQNENLLSQDITTGETSVTVAGGGDIQLCVLGHTYLGSWTNGRPVRLDTWFEAAQAIESLLFKVANPPQTPPPVLPDYTTDVNELTAQVEALKSHLQSNGQVK